MDRKPNLVSIVVSVLVIIGIAMVTVFLLFAAWSGRAEPLKLTLAPLIRAMPPVIRPAKIKVEVPRVLSGHDQDGDGIDDLEDILLEARAEATRQPRYKNAYYRGGYPPFGIVSDRRRDDGVPLLIHNGGPYAAENDFLTSWPSPISNHFRFPNSSNR